MNMFFVNKRVLKAIIIIVKCIFHVLSNERNGDNTHIGNKNTKMKFLHDFSKTNFENNKFKRDIDPHLLIPNQKMSKLRERKLEALYPIFHQNEQDNTEEECHVSKNRNTENLEEIDHLASQPNPSNVIGKADIINIYDNTDINDVNKSATYLWERNDKEDFFSKSDAILKGDVNKLATDENMLPENSDMKDFLAINNVLDESENTTEYQQNKDKNINTDMDIVDHVKSNMNTVLTHEKNINEMLSYVNLEKEIDNSTSTGSQAKNTNYDHKSNFSKLNNYSSNANDEQPKNTFSNKDDISALTNASSNSGSAKRSSGVPVQMVYEKHECVYGHNKLRMLHQARRLEWDEELAYECEKYALHLAILNPNPPQHSSFYNEKGQKYGENLYLYRGGQKDCRDAIFLWFELLKAMASPDKFWSRIMENIEHANYRHEHASNVYASGHFIQLVWDQTRRVGAGIAYANGITWIVARYLPPSNTAVERIGDYVKKSLHHYARVIPQDLIALRPKPHWIETIHATLSANSDCMDTNPYCKYYKYNGYCKQKQYKDMCPFSCGKCKGGPYINGGFTEWVTARSCSTTCGTGTLIQHRYCSNPEPSGGGKKCLGATTRSQKCEDHSCPNKYRDCSDKRDDCLTFAKEGHCTMGKYRKYMEKNCQTSCGLCKDCRDNTDQKKCTQYVQKEKRCYKRKYMSYMKKNCQAFCCEYTRFFLTSGNEILEKFKKTKQKFFEYEYSD